MTSKFYEITLKGDELLTLTYQLEENNVAKTWASLIAKATVDNLRPTLNPWRNFDKSQLPNKIAHLENLITLLNEWLPAYNKITGTWNYNDHQASVNKFHIHFPEQEKNETDPIRRAQLAEYNDLIHEIELLCKSSANQPRLLLCPDGIELIEFTDFDYNLFSAKRFFGELCLHYCHVGRHPYEIYMANDYRCPVDQIVPMRYISALHTLRFYTDPTPEHVHQLNFRRFYNNSTIKEVYDINDPKIAFGYITLGKLVTDKDESIILNQVSQCNKVIDWKIY